MSSRLLTTGMEIGSGATEPSPDGANGGANTPTRDTSIFRSGVASVKFNATASDSTRAIDLNTSGATVYAQVCIYVSALPTSNADIIALHSGSTVGAKLTLNTSGTVALRTSGGTVIATSTSAVAATTWTVLELRLTVVAAGDDTYELKMDGVSEFSGTAAITTISSVSRIMVGWISAPGSNRDLYVDDIIIDSAAYPNGAKVALMKPASVSQSGSWTGGAGGAVQVGSLNGTPPTGTSAETDATQIESTDDTGDNATDELRADCGSYTAAGVGSGDTINSINVVCAHGEDVSTGTKTGSVGGQANPAQTYATFTFGADVGALGVYSTGWRWARTISNDPSVTKGSSLILGLRKTDAGTRVASCCFLGAYVDYTPGSAGSAPPASYIQSQRIRLGR